MKTRSLAERFWEKVDKNGPVHPVLGTRCWTWTAHCDSKGYGEIGAGGKDGANLRAHRVSWEMHRGPIPTGTNVLHHCDNRRCPNPAHLFLGTNADNTNDMMAKGRNVEPPGTSENRAKTHCPQGHAYDGQNLRRSPGNRRYCLTCKRQKKRDHDARRKHHSPPARMTA